MPDEYTLDKRIAEALLAELGPAAFDCLMHERQFTIATRAGIADTLTEHRDADVPGAGEEELESVQDLHPRAYWLVHSPSDRFV